MAEGRKLANKSDIWLMLAILVFSVSVYRLYLFSQESAGKAVCRILCEGKTAMIVSLVEDRTFSLPQYPQILFEIKDGGICFQTSNCPDKICVRSGYIYLPGQSAVCLPNHVIIRLESSDGKTPPDGVDTIAW